MGSKGKDLVNKERMTVLHVRFNLDSRRAVHHAMQIPFSWSGFTGSACKRGQERLRPESHPRWLMLVAQAWGSCSTRDSLQARGSCSEPSNTTSAQNGQKASPSIEVHTLVPAIIGASLLGLPEPKSGAQWLHGVGLVVPHRRVGGPPWGGVGLAL